MVLKPVPVPSGYFPIEIVQFWCGERAPGRPHPLRWIILVHTSPHRGNIHELVSDGRAYVPHHRWDVPLAGLHLRADWRGSIVVGYVAPGRLHDLWTRMARVPLKREDDWIPWNGQNWVHEALEGFLHCDLYTDVNMTLAALQTHMSCLLEVWELGDL